MSLGPSSLGNLLAQRLDTVLGISQSGQARTGAHPDALRQAQPTNRLVPTENQNQRGQQADRALGDKAGQAGERGRDTTVGRQDPRVASQLQRFITDSRFTQSAPTTLGRTARTILALLSSQQGNQPIQGKAPLLQPRQLTQALQQMQQGTPGQQTQPATAQNSTSASAQAQQPQISRRGLPPISQSGFATPAQNAGAALRAALPLPAGTNAPSASAQTQSPTAAPAQSAPNTAAIATLARAAGGPTALVNVFMQALSQNVQQSGMFYESHLAQLVKGQTTATQLQQQPQAQAHLQAATEGAETKQSKSLQAAQTATTLQQSGIDPSTQQIVRQQLEVLANQLFAWRGEAWPGVPMELEVQRRQEQDGDTDEEAASEDESNTPWQTRLRVELPNLGEVEARLYIDEKSLRMHLRAPHSAEHLNLNLQPLVQRLQAQGINIEQLQIAAAEDHDEQ